MWRVVSRASPGSGPLPPGAPRRRRGGDRAPAAEGGARPLRAGTGRAAPWTPRSRARGGLHLPRRSSPPRNRAAPGRTARTPAARGALGPCHRASPGAAATPGPGSDRRPRGAQRRGRAVPPGPRVRSEAVRCRCARPARPLGSGAPPLRSLLQPTQASARRARGRRRRLAARPRSPAARARSRARPGHAPRSPRAREGVPSGPAHARWIRWARCRAASWRLRREVWWMLERFHPPGVLRVDLPEPEPGGSPARLARSPPARPC